MNNTEKNMESLLNKVELRERAARRNILLFSVIPVVLAGLLVWYTSNSVSTARRKVVTAELRLDSLNRQINKLEEQLSEVTNIDKYLFELTPQHRKIIYLKNEKIYSLLDTILNMKQRNVKWNRFGRSPDEGFTSSSYAGFILKKLDILDTAIYTQQGLMEYLPHLNAPRPGCLIFYETGYTMFYLVGDNDTSFCIGMTPFGIASMKIDFGPKILGYGEVKY
jgi:hypothetical protein